MDHPHPIFRPTMYVLFWVLLLLLALIVVYKFDIATRVQAFVVLDDGPTESEVPVEVPLPRKRRHRATIDNAVRSATKHGSSFDTRRAPSSEIKSLSADFALGGRVSHRSRSAVRGGREPKSPRPSVSSITFAKRFGSPRAKSAPYKSAISRRSKQGGAYPERLRSRKSSSVRHRMHRRIPIMRVENESLTEHVSSIVTVHSLAKAKSSSIEQGDE